ncbi:MAG TPA: FAD-dependent thymidylate synthase [Leptospiraceae bacterium]|nr:FAD-dependent thymidylate synthase [Leptospiraceae bacterium]
MQVRLITKTSGESGTEYEGKSIDEIITGIARLSSSREVNDLFKEPEKLLRHCLLNGHWSVFTEGNLTFEIFTSRAIGRELLRHWTLKPQEISQRYVEIGTFEDIELRKQSKSNRQSSTDIIDDPELNTLAASAVDNSVEVYKQLLAAGVARECARLVLPETTQTKLIMNGTVREWITTLNQRLHKTAQKECRLVAEEIRDIFIQKCPIISQALFNFEHAYDIHILDRLVLEKYKVFDQVFVNVN